MTVIITAQTAWNVLLAPNSASAFNDNTNYLIIMKGTQPEDFSTFYNPTTDLLSDQLVVFRNVTNDAVGYSEANPGYYISKWNLRGDAVAVNSGTATWFLWCSYYSLRYYNMMGTVGELGSDSNLEIYDTNIVAGRSYRMADIIWTVPLVDT